MTQLEPLVFNKAEIATMLGICKRTLETWIASDTFPPADIRHGNVLRWYRETFHQWLGRQPK